MTETTQMNFNLGNSCLSVVADWANQPVPVIIKSRIFRHCLCVVPWAGSAMGQLGVLVALRSHLDLQVSVLGQPKGPS